MNKIELEKLFQDSLQEVRDDTNSFVVQHVTAVVSLVFSEMALKDIAEDPKNAARIARLALGRIEGITFDKIANLLGLSSSDERVN